MEEKNIKQGKLFVVTGPSGVGKGTILANFFKQDNKNLYYSVSMTTRAPRPNEKDGVNYLFVSKDEFRRAIEKDEFLEWTEYSGNFYGTNNKIVSDKLNNGINVILEIETKGAKKVMEKYKDAITIFISPPSVFELESRLRGRHTEDEKAIQKRLDEVERELSESSNYKYVIVNDELSEALKKFKAVYDFEVK